jgi:CDP-diacylglycerol--glycerol-3-phosphate 3-phosphatidyltransferase
MNIANKLTLLRVALIPVFLIVMYWGFPYHQYVGLLIFIGASLTDFVDGHLARSRNLVTDFGKFMDPLADKVLVVTAMLWFVQTGVIPAWAVAIVILREFAVSGRRLIAVEQGRVIAAAWSGKIKTASTMVGIMLMMAFGIPMKLEWLNIAVSIVIAVTTLYSGAEYFIKNKDVLSFK